MQVPAPHAAFPLGDTIPFTVELLTDETGQPWRATSLGAKDAVQLELRTPAGASYGSYDLEPVAGKPATFTLPINSGGGWRRGLYRYSIRLGREKSNYGPVFSHTYTLLSGTFTLT